VDARVPCEPYIYWRRCKKHQVSMLILASCWILS
jgi:hypothetical protein